MSDVEDVTSPIEPKSEDERDERPTTKKRPRIVDPDEEEDDAEAAVDTKEDNEKAEDIDEDKDEDGDEDEDENEDEDEDEDDEENGGERRRKRRRKQKRYRFLDVEAEVDDEDEEEDEDNDYGDVAEFIDEAPEEGAAQNDYQHRRLDRSFGRNEEEDVQDIVQRLKERHARTAAARYNGDSDAVPQRLLMPGVNDPSLWRVFVKTGREAAICASIFRKVFSQQYSANPIEVISVFFRDSLTGMIFLEARQSAAVSAAISGIVGIFASKGVSLVPIEEMAPLLKIKKKDVNLAPGMWIRMKRGKHTGDLAQVVDTDQITSGVVGIKFIPRIDLTPREKRKERAATGKALGASSIKPPSRLFSYDDVRKIYGRQSVRQGAQGSYFFDNDEYIDGFCVKDVKIAVIESENVNPTLEEISRFSGDDQSTAKFDLSAIADANKNLTVSVLLPGDQVEVYEGEQTGLYGRVATVTQDVIAIKAVGGEVHDQIIEVPSRSVRKRFDVGEHVKVLAGKNQNATGMVVEVKGDVVTLMSDQGEQEIKVFSKDIRKAADTSNTTKTTGLYDQHDLVMLDSTTAAVVTKVEGSLLRVLDQNGAARSVTPDQVTLRRDNKRFAVATDSQGNDMKVGDNMKETEGENRQGEVINIFRSLFVFLHNRDLTENNGVFVARAQSLISVTPKSAVSDLGKMNPALNQQLPYGGASLMPPPATNFNRNRLINTLVVVTKGTSKGLMGTIRDIQGDNARVELKTNNKTLTIALTSLKRKDQKTGATYPLEAGAGPGGYGRGPAAGGYDVNPYSGAPMNGGQTPGGLGGRTPAPGQFGRTPNPYAAGGIGGKTPNPYATGAAAGGRTPAPGWGADGKTPAPGWGGAGGKTPGWAGSGGKTPAPGFDGGRTPAWGAGAGAGGKTPNPYSNAGPSGGRTPAPASSMYGSNLDAGGSRNNGPITAPTPYGGSTPGIYSAPTPAAPSNPYSAPTPFTAPTPYGGPPTYAAPTPGAALSAPTPGMGGPTPYGAPTPFGAPTPYGGGATNGGVGGLPWDWALDFRNVIVEVGPSLKPNTRSPLHFQRGAHDGKKFGYDQINGESCHCISLDSGDIIEDIPAEYLRPSKPDQQGQVVVCIGGGPDTKGQQRTTQYENGGSWMMELDHGDLAPLVLEAGDLCRIWKM
ncbi:transcription elongation factor SPT5 [Kwoniella dejecticola CBS 10117]|uniref:Transcription elongation factor SPT5 n=1 Tax=Kwoniella dejecticola CBS 10117 TaxID=1296121 RepID=A0A1A5ZVV4_9TREE|nr:transcription elongation factor SPT5 [Kwoniella dejecticola CBS 10117]OBR81940.1 transcription elongation factor SPT5 [Kwoniella dejecticola CBS 10117]